LLHDCHFTSIKQGKTMTRNSRSHPIEIAEIPVLAGVMGLTFCPGKRGKSHSGDTWDRDIGVDLQALKVWGASIIVSLMEKFEFDMLGVPELEQEAQNAGIDWVHLPIKDVSAPGGEFMSTWANLTKQLQRRLSRGHRVVIHCRGGLGRTGVVASLLLLDLGWSAQAALNAVRRARPGAIETWEQEQYVHTYLPYLCHASLLGGAIGDSLGADIEFAKLQDIRTNWPGGVQSLSQRASATPGWFTDDTQMTLFTAEGLVRAHIRAMSKGICSYPSVVHSALMRWLSTQGEETLHADQPCKGLIEDRNMWFRASPGLTCLSALSASNSFGDKARNDSKGCGTIMRVAPVAFAVERNMVREIAIETSALTHGHPVGQLAASAWAEILCGVLDGVSEREAAEEVARAYSKDLDKPGEIVASSIYRALNAPADGRPETVEKLGGGWVAEEALAIALYAALNGRDFEDGLRIAVTHSGDSDSTGAIAGNLLGIFYPDQVLEHRWAREVGGRHLIGPLALDLPLARFWTSEIEFQATSYPPG